MNARPITWPTVPKGKDRVRVCLHAGNTAEEVERLAREMVEWALSELRDSGVAQTVEVAGKVVMTQSKL